MQLAVSETKVVKFSYAFVALAIIVVAWLKLETPFLAILFSTLALQLLNVSGKKWLAVVLFLLLVAAILFGLVSFAREAFQTLPGVVDRSIPIVVQHAEEYGFDLSFGESITSFKTALSEFVKNELNALARFANILTHEFVFLIIAFVIAISFFLDSKIDLDERADRKDLYAQVTHEISIRLTRFFGSFKTVMGAQIVISAINTILTAIFVYVSGLPYANVVVVITFLCGLLPIIGNLISNTLIVSIALTLSPSFAIGSLTFLVALHKLEYFLNSKIVGGRIRNPMWLTLLSLIVGERLMGIPGMILAPVVLHYIKVECGKIMVS